MRKGETMRNFLFKARLIAFILALIASQWDAGRYGHDQSRR